jgi:uncharacterized membrane protein YphA (DoxX/SURF4 family)
MWKLASRVALFLPFWLMATPVFAHVKWFLDEPECECLKQSKPDLFVKPGFENLGVVLLGLIALHVVTSLSRRFDNWPFNRHLSTLAITLEPVVNLAMGAFTGGLLIWCAFSKTMFVPNMAVTGAMPPWLLPLQAIVGLGLIVGLAGRACASAMLILLFSTFSCFSLSDCIDLLPMYGIAIYFLLVGRTGFSLDTRLGFGKASAGFCQDLAYMALRSGTGIGLALLGIDEKLLNPQLALDVLQQKPALNFMHWAGMNNEMFVLCAGVAEVVVGLMIVFGSFPRLAMLFLAGLFAGTTILFGTTELFGHMPYYGVILAILLRGGATVQSQRKRSQASLDPVGLIMALRHRTDKPLPAVVELK